ncbi:MAG: hypothetical protein HLUCCO02_02240 [Idiomarinaceae bacterium HL-53]|nr:MAG: hypothetical protein HLUCCO02_02240 [Idiomarinaceae bacterium HL-53]CUS48838.1 hypothetical protein Ga0003345_1818 [Idiomarinaceae bacterium HL-53]
MMFRTQKLIVLLTFCLFSSYPAHADRIERVFTIGLSGVVSAVEQNIEDFKVSKPAYFVGWYGKFDSDPGGLGVYASLGVPEHKITGFTTETNHFNVFNMGVIYSLERSYQLYGGLGYAQQVHDDPAMQTESFYNNYLNVGLGITYPFW